VLKFEEFFEICRKYNLDPQQYLTQSILYLKLSDYTLYGVEEVSEYTELSSRQVLRILAKGPARPMRGKPYQFYGIDIKNAFYKYYYRLMIQKTSFEKDLAQKEYS
jgi:hypothetical protein